MKTIKAWAVVDKDGELVWGSGLSETEAQAETTHVPDEGERVVRVTITVEEE